MTFRKYELYCKPSKVGEGRYDAVRISTVHDAYEACKILGLEKLSREKVYALYLDVKGRLIGVFEVAAGALESAVVDPKVVFSAALSIGRTAGLMLAHNHTSGDNRPSIEDKLLTNRIKEAGSILGVELIDHIIISETGYYSFAENKEI